MRQSEWYRKCAEEFRTVADDALQDLYTRLRFAKEAVLYDRLAEQAALVDGDYRWLKEYRVKVGDAIFLASSNRK